MCGEGGENRGIVVICMWISCMHVFLHVSVPK